MSNAQNTITENTALFSGQTTQSLDGLYAKAAEFILTPDDTFKRKLDLIEHAEDMSTSQKIEAMNQVEDRHIADKIIYTVLAISLIVASTPEGRKAIGSAIKSFAVSVAPLYSRVAGQMVCCFAFIETGQMELYWYSMEIIMRWNSVIPHNEDSGTYKKERPHQSCQF